MTSKDRAAPSVNPSEISHETEAGDLRSKLRALEARAADDARRLSQLGALETEKSAWVTIRTKLREKLQTQQVEIKELKEKVSRLEQTMKTMETEVKIQTDKNLSSDVTELLEMATLDREMAEEERDQLKMQLSHLEGRIEELSLELEIRRDEDQLAESDKSASDTRILRVQNERMRKALIRLKEISEEQERTIVESDKDSERRITEMHTMKSQIELLSGQLIDMENLVEDLKSQVNISIGAEEMLEALTDRNLVLGEQVEKYRADIVDLESLKELSDEMEENHVQARKELMEEYNLQSAVVREQTARIADAENLLSEYTMTVEKFRELVKRLESEIEELKQTDAGYQAQSAELSQHARDLLLQNTTLRSNEHKAILRQFDGGLKQIEIAVATEHLQILQEYLPATYESDRDSVHAYLTATRLHATCNLMLEAMKRQVLGTKLTDDSSSLLGICHFLMQMCCTAQWFAESLRHATPEAFIICKKFTHDLVALLEVIQTQITLFQQDAMVEADTLASMEKSALVVTHLQEQFTVVLGSSRLLTCHINRLSGAVDLLKLSFDRAAVRIEKTLADSISRDLKTLADLVVQSEELAQNYDDEQISEQVISVLAGTTGDISSITRSEALLPFSDSMAESPRMSIVQDSRPIEDVLRQAIQQLKDVVSGLASLTERGRDMIAVVSPWQLRGSEQRRPTNVETGSQDRLDAIQQDLQDTIFQLHLKTEALDEERMKSQTLSRRIQVQNDSFEEALNSAADQRKSISEREAYEAAMAELNNQVESLQEQLSQARPSFDQQIPLSAHDSVTRTEAEVFRQTIKYLNHELATLKRSGTAKDFAFLSKPLIASGSKQNGTSQAFHKAIRKFATSIRIVDFTENPPAQKQWAPRRERCGFLHFLQEQEYAQLLSMKRQIGSA